MMLRSSRTTKVFALLLLILAAITAQADAGLPTDQIKTTVDNALTVRRDPKLKPAAKLKDLRDQLKQILFARFDFTEIAKRALGADWRRRRLQESVDFVLLVAD